MYSTACFNVESDWTYRREITCCLRFTWAEAYIVSSLERRTSVHELTILIDSFLIDISDLFRFNYHSSKTSYPLEVYSDFLKSETKLTPDISPIDSMQSFIFASQQSHPSCRFSHRKSPPNLARDASHERDRCCGFRTRTLRQI